MGYKGPFTSLLSDSTGSQEAAITLEQFRERLAGMRTLFDYEVAPRDFTQKNLISLEKELREILKEIATSPGMQYLLPSADAAQDALHTAITKLNLAADVFDMKKTLKLREQLYQLYIDIHKYISLAIKCLQVKN